MFECIFDVVHPNAKKEKRSVFSGRFLNVSSFPPETEAHARELSHTFPGYEAQTDA